MYFSCILLSLGLQSEYFNWYIKVKFILQRPQATVNIVIWLWLAVSQFSILFGISQKYAAWLLIVSNKTVSARFLAIERKE